MPGAFKNHLGSVFLFCLVLALVACGVYAFVRVGTVQDAMDRLLEDGDFTRGHKAVKGRLTALTAAYWLVVVAIFLSIPFWKNKYIRASVKTTKEVSTHA